MAYFIKALQIVAPTVVYMAVGILLRKTGVVVESEIKRLNEFIFKLFIPLAIFSSLYKADAKTINDPFLFTYVAVGILIVFLVCYILISRKIKNKETAATLVQGIYRSCYVLIGIPLALSLSGGEGAGRLAALAAVVAPVNTVLAVWIFEHARSEKIGAWAMGLKILKNPLIIACIMGIGLNLLGRPLPNLLIEPLTTLGSAATPVCLVVLGSALNFSGLKKNRKLVGIAVIFGLIIVPLVAVGGAVALGMRNAQLAAVIGSFAAPNDIVSAPMAYAMGGDGQLASQIVALSTVLSVFTIFAFVYTVLKFGWIVL